jgi:hypothetical protein
MNIFRLISRAFIGDPGDPSELDYVPVGKVDCRTPEKIEAARGKLGRPFTPEIKVSRTTPPSHSLEHINAQAEEAKRVKATVTHIRRQK